MKIGFFSDSYFPEIDGVTYTLKTWKERLSERGHEVYIIYPDSNRYESGSSEVSISSFSNPFYEGYDIPCPLFRDDYPELDIVHCHSPGPLGISGLRHARKNNIPAIYTHHTPVEEYFEQSVGSKIVSRPLEDLYVRIEEYFLKKFDVLTASTTEPRRSLHFKKLPVGLDMEFFYPVEESFIDESSDRPVIGYSGRMSMEKNLDEILEMAQDFDGKVIMVGEGPLKQSLVEKAPENVEMMDFLDREELRKFYSDIDVFVTASTGDTLGLSTLEANACGTPVVAPDAVPFKNTIGPHNGFRYSLENGNEFIEKIRKANESTLDTRSAVEKYSVSKTIDDLLEMYEEILDGN